MLAEEKTGWDKSTRNGKKKCLDSHFRTDGKHRKTSTRLVGLVALWRRERDTP